jgi:hypothetical protein
VIHHLKTFWPLYLLYSLELSVFIIMSLSALVANFDSSTLFFVSSNIYSELAQWNGERHILLAAPVIFGFIFRQYFVRVLWPAYHWFEFLSGYMGDEFLQKDWIELTAMLSHFGLVLLITGVLFFSQSARTFFKNNGFSKALENSVNEDNKAAGLDETFLEMRIRKRSSRQYPVQNNQMRLAQGCWGGIALMIWGGLLDEHLFAFVGFVIFIGCFLFLRSSYQNNKS